MSQPPVHFPLFPTAFEDKYVFECLEFTCAICGEQRAWRYRGPTYGPFSGEEVLLCPWCIENGEAAKRGVTFNDSTQYPDFPETVQLPDAERAVIEQRTPGFITWQQNRWLGCCGRACIYLGEAKEGDLQGRCASAVADMFALDEFSEEDQRAVLDNIGSGSPAAYVFQCQLCRRLRAFWDCD